MSLLTASNVIEHSRDSQTVLVNHFFYIKITDDKLCPLRQQQNLKIEIAQVGYVCMYGISGNIHI